MVIAVIERRSEIGLRRAIGATKGHIRRQFLTEALILAALGGIAGVVIGVGVTAGYASTQGWGIIIPPEAVIGGFVAALAIGAIAGLYPAMRAANLPPTEASVQLVRTSRSCLRCFPRRRPRRRYRCRSCEF